MYTFVVAYQQTLGINEKYSILKMNISISWFLLKLIQLLQDKLIFLNVHCIFLLTKLIFYFILLLNIGIKIEYYWNKNATFLNDLYSTKKFFFNWKWRKNKETIPKCINWINFVFCLLLHGLILNSKMPLTMYLKVEGIAIHTTYTIHHSWKGTYMNFINWLTTTTNKKLKTKTFDLSTHSLRTKTKKTLIWVWYMEYIWKQYRIVMCCTKY